VLRHILTEGGISSRKFGAVFAGFFYFFKRKIPKKEDLVYRKTLKARFMRLAHKDAMDIRAEVLSLGDIADTYTISYMTDCSFYGEERMVSYVAYANPDMSGPTTAFTGIGALPKKDAKTCAVEAFDRLMDLLGPEGVQRMFGSCQDHAALNELQHFFAEAALRGIVFCVRCGFICTL